VSEEGITITKPGNDRNITYLCRIKAKADYSKLQEVLPPEQ
jgi:hypothetical protein